MSDRAVAGGELRPSGLHRGEALAQPTEFASPLAEIEARFNDAPSQWPSISTSADPSRPCAT